MTDFMKKSTQKVNDYIQSIQAEGVKLDSTAPNGVEAPDEFRHVLDEAEDKSEFVQKALLDGVANYRAAHGYDAPADLIESAIHAAYSTTYDAKRKYALDSATSNAHDPLSLQPNRAVVAILSAFSEAIPFAHYLPADIGSNEARLAIMSHKAGATFGSYKAGGLLDGVLSGDPYISSSRVNTSKPVASGAVTGKITKIQKTEDTCDENAGDLKLLRGRTIVYVNGKVAAREAETTGSGDNAINGSVTIGSTRHVIGGTVNTDTGAYSLTSNPALPTSVNVAVEGFIDFERQPDITPSVISAVDVYKLYAKPWRVYTQQTIDSRTQMTNELNLDPYSESVLAIQTQFANERHFEALRKGVRLGVNNTLTFDWGQAKQFQDSGRAAVWMDLSYPLAALSQQMAVDTMNHGVTHIYVTKNVMAQLRGLPSTIFQPSGVSERPGIYRVGRLFGQYEVYYTPKGLKETPTSAQILCVGRATDVARNPIILGDAVAPTVMPLALNTDLRAGAGFYARNFTEVNPHEPSAMGFGIIEVVNF